jgi:mannose-6-phosphate isomerase
MVEAGRWSDLLNELPIHKGDFFQIDPGTIHAIKGGTLILESQQSSDVTYRVYDYDRVQADGTKRPLHVEQSVECTNYAAKAPVSGKVTAPEVDGVTELESCSNYTVDRVRVSGERTLPAPEYFLDVSVIDGEGTACGHPVRKGSHFVVPAGLETALAGDMCLITSRV